MFVAYNRRFYTDVEHLREQVVVDGGTQPAVFEFTEWSHQIMIFVRVRCDGALVTSKLHM